MDVTDGIPESTPSVELSDYLKVLRERRLVILATMVVIVGAVLLFGLLSTPDYRATAQILRQRASLDTALFGTRIFELRDVQREIQTGANLVRLEAVASRVKDDIGSSRSTDELREMVEVSPEGQTDIIRISAVSVFPDEAASVANSFAESFIAYRQQADRSAVAATAETVQAELSSMSVTERASERGVLLTEKYESLRILEQMQTGGYEIAQLAIVPTEPFAPRPLRDGLLALAVALVVGVGLAFVLEYLDKRIKDEETLEREFGLPLLAAVPSVGKRWKRSPKRDPSAAPIGFLDPQSPFLESYRTLRSNMQYFEVDRPLHTILITSALPQEGKTVTTINLAISLALTGAKVIVLEADLRRPMVHQYMKLGADIGVSNVLAGTHSFAEAMQLVRVDEFAPTGARRSHHGEADPSLLQKNLYCITSGPLPPNPAELVASERMSSLIAKAAETADYVVIDTPPVLLVADALSLAGQADAVVVAARMYHTTRDQARETRTRLDRARAHCIGVVAGGVSPRKGYYQYGYYGTEGA